MRRLDKLHLDYPFAVARMLALLVQREGIAIGRRSVSTLMKRMGNRGDLSAPEHQQTRAGTQDLPLPAARREGRKVERPNHVWATDISYVPMRRGFVYLAAVVDVATRRVLAHRVSITMEATFCVEALEEALARHGDRRHVTAVQRDGCSFS